MEAVLYVAGIARDEGCKYLIFAGDWFEEGKKVDADVIWFSSRLLKEVAKWFKEVILIPGNHDYFQYVRGRTLLESFASDNIRVISKPTTLVFSSCFIYLFPFSLTFKDDLEEALRKSPGKDRAWIAIAHAGTDNVSFYCQGDTVLTNPVPVDSFKRFDLTLLGHYHIRQAVNSRVKYIGACRCRNFKDEGVEPCFEIIDVGPDHLMTQPFNLDTLPTFKTVNVDSDDDLPIIIRQKEFVRIKAATPLLERRARELHPNIPVVTGRSIKKEELRPVEQFLSLSDAMSQYIDKANKAGACEDLNTRRLKLIGQLCLNKV
jgi:DNA repair exonuclease SbcCD nuclease subunit